MEIAVVLIVGILLGLVVPRDRKCSDHDYKHYGTSIFNDPKTGEISSKIMHFKCSYCDNMKDEKVV